MAKFLAVLATRQDADASADEQEEAEEFLEKLLAFLVRRGSGDPLWPADFLPLTPGTTWNSRVPP